MEHAMSPLSKEDVETVISRAVGSNVQIHSHNLEPFSKTKEGFLGTHYKLTVDVEDESGEKVYTFFLKTHLEDSTFGDEDFVKISFDEEETFFDKVHPLMLENYKGEKWSAECYLVKPGVLVFQDLRTEGYAVTGFTAFSLNTVELTAFLKTLARFHACSILAETKLGKPLNEAFPDYFVEKLYNKNFKIWKTNEIALDTTVLMAKKLGLDPTDVPRILDHICKILGHQDGNVNVVNHGDLHRNNLMFNNDEPRKCVLVDYQILRYTSFACDLNLVLHVNKDPKSTESEKDLFGLYYTIFQETLQQSGIRVRIPSYEKMWKEYEEHRIFGLWSASQFFSFQCFTPEEGIAIMQDPEGMNRCLFGDRFGLYEPYLDSNPDYAARMKEILNELFNEAKRIL